MRAQASRLRAWPRCASRVFPAATGDLGAAAAAPGRSDVGLSVGAAASDLRGGRCSAGPCAPSSRRSGCRRGAGQHRSTRGAPVPGAGPPRAVDRPGEADARRGLPAARRLPATRSHPKRGSGRAGGRRTRRCARRLASRKGSFWEIRPTPGRCRPCWALRRRAGLYALGAGPQGQGFSGALLDRG